MLLVPVPIEATVPCLSGRYMCMHVHEVIQGPFIMIDISLLSAFRRLVGLPLLPERSIHDSNEELACTKEFLQQGTALSDY